MVNSNVVEVELWSATWWRGFHGLHRFGCLGLGLGRGRGLVVGGWGWVSISHLSPSISSLYFTAMREKKKSSVLLVCDFLAPGLRVNFLLEGKQSQLSATAELKLFS
jgi:hypothetical protein